jgi:transketolase
VRDAFARTIYERAKVDDRVCVLVADISPAGAMEEFRRDFPDRFINVGVAEQTMIGMAAGMAQRGLRPFCYTIATFALFRPYEFIRCDLAYQKLPVTIVGMGAGLSYSTLGGTHQAIEDVAVASAIPGMTVLAPCDPRGVADMTRWCAGREAGGPVYMRIGKAGEPDLTAEADTWLFGKSRRLRTSTVGHMTMSLVSYGPILSEVLEVGRRLDMDVFEVPVLAGDAGTTVDDLISKLPYEAAVVEEAHGAPLQRLLRSRLDYDAELELQSICIEGFPHVHGSRSELLEHCGLSARKIFDALGDWEVKWEDGN